MRRDAVIPQRLHAGDPLLGHDLQDLVNWTPMRDPQIFVKTIWVVRARKV